METFTKEVKYSAIQSERNVEIFVHNIKGLIFFKKLQINELIHTIEKELTCLLKCKQTQPHGVHCR